MKEGWGHWRGMWTQDKEYKMEEIIACLQAINIILYH